MYDDPRPEQQQPYPRSPTAQPYRGPRRRHRETGQVEVWVEGEGYVPEGSPFTLSTGDQEDLQNARRGLSTARRNAQLAESFFRENSRPRQGMFDSGGETGGTAALPVPAWSGMQNPTRQRMEGLTNQMVRANIQPGQAGTMNSFVEQMLARQQYPTTETWGEVNGQRVVDMMTDAAELTAFLDEAERWAQEHRGLQGFDVHWTRNRSEAVRRAARTASIARLRIPQEARQDLLSDPSPEARREFDEVFGQGWANYIISQNGR